MVHGTLRRSIGPKTIETLRKDGGGLICLAVPSSAAERLDLPFMTDVLERDDRLRGISCRKTAYGDKPSFSISINHKDVYTGITDNDRALTITKFDELIRSRLNTAKTQNRKLKTIETLNPVTQNFYSPGHVFLLIGREIENRRGHTELSLELAKRAGLKGGMVLCEMLGNGTGNALSKKKAQEYAKKNGLVFVEGKEIVSIS
jgi:3,4-dihydroxy 2-butanone 4-phosphate synthase